MNSKIYYMYEILLQITTTVKFHKYVEFEFKLYS